MGTNEINEIDWSMSKEEVLQALNRQYSKILEGSDFSIMRNSTKGEMNLDLFKVGEKQRVGQLWPKVRDRRIEIVLARDIVDMIKNEVAFPEDINVKKNRNLVRGYYKDIDYEKTTAIIKAIRYHCK